MENVHIMVQCEECEMWRLLLYSRSNLTTEERESLQQDLDKVTSGKIDDVYYRDYSARI